MNEDDIRKNFEEFGKILEINVKDGYGFLTYDNEKSAKRAIDKLHRSHIFGQGRINVE